MKIYDFEQRSDEWWKVRLGKFGSSDAQSVQASGKGLETLCFKKVAELASGRVKNNYTNKHIKRGIELEPVARTAYEMETGKIVREIGYAEKDEWVGCSPDGLVSEDGLIEIKCPCDRKFIELLFTEEIQTGYFWQMQHQMWVCERKWCDFVNYNKNLNRTYIRRLEKDDTAIKKIKKGIKYGIRRIKEIQKKIGGKIERNNFK